MEPEVIFDRAQAAFRRPLHDLIEPLMTAGFAVERISEPTLDEALKAKDPKGYERLRRLPAFIFVRARKLRADGQERHALFPSPLVGEGRRPLL